MSGYEPTSGFVVASESGDGRTIIEHRNGVPWYEAPPPLRRHTCEVQTNGWTNYFTHVQRCACGAIRGNGSSHWSEVNSRQPLDEEQRPAMNGLPYGWWKSPNLWAFLLVWPATTVLLTTLICLWWLK